MYTEGMCDKGLLLAASLVAKYLDHPVLRVFPARAPLSRPAPGTARFDPATGDRPGKAVISKGSPVVISSLGLTNRAVLSKLSFV
jgi:hypothetical protein